MEPRPAAVPNSGNRSEEELVALGELVTAKGAHVVGRFFCAGQFLFLVSRNHPDGKDLEDARTFVQELASG